MPAGNGIRKWRTSVSKTAVLGPRAAIFGPKKPWNTFKTAKRRETVGALHVWLDFPVSWRSLRPSNYMICPRNGPKRPHEAPNADTHKPRIGISLATWLKMRFRGHLLHPQPPTFCAFHPSELPKRTPRPQYLGPLECQHKCFWTVLSLWWPILVLRKSQNALKMRCFGTKSGSKMGRKHIFPNLILDHLGCTNG